MTNTRAAQAPWPQPPRKAAWVAPALRVPGVPSPFELRRKLRSQLFFDRYCNRGVSIALDVRHVDSQAQAGGRGRGGAAGVAGGRG